MDYRSLEGSEWRRDYPQADRDRMAKSGEALPDGSYPIADRQDLEDAIHAIGRGTHHSHEAIREHIIRRAHALGLESLLPDTWSTTGRSEPAVDLSYRANLTGVRESRRVGEFELREKDAGTLQYTGYASIFDVPYEVNSMVLGTFQESIAQRSFRRSLSEGADVQFLVNHDDMALPLARTKSGTMRLGEDSRGLHTEANFDLRNPQVISLRSAVDRGDVDEMSFSFRVYEGGQEWSDDFSQRRLTSVNIHKGDVSIVNHGANPATAGMVGIRSAQDAVRELRAGNRLSPDAIALIEAAIAKRIGEPKPVQRGMSLIEAETLIDF